MYFFFFLKGPNFTTCSNVAICHYEMYPLVSFPPVLGGLVEKKNRRPLILRMHKFSIWVESSMNVMSILLGYGKANICFYSELIAWFSQIEFCCLHNQIATHTDKES